MVNDKMNPLLSIITPVYNVESYLDRCIKSIVNQSYREIELILIDDGSTDGSLVVCKKWAAKDERVVVYHKKNGGVSSARNVGLEIASGEYLTFVDPDDFLAPETYKKNMEYIFEHKNVDILQFPYCYYYDEKKIDNYHTPSPVLLVGSMQIFKNWWSGTPLEYVIWNKISKRALWDDIRFKVGHISEDTCLVPKFIERAKTVYISNQGLYYYQQDRACSYTFGEYSFEKHLDLFYAHAEIYNCFKLFPEMVTEKVLAFTRLFRRLITAKHNTPSADICVPIQIIKQNFPSWSEILVSQQTEKMWLSFSKLMGPDLFIAMFLKYLNWKYKQNIF